MIAVYCFMKIMTDILKTRIVCILEEQLYILMQCPLIAFQSKDIVGSFVYYPGCNVFLAPRPRFALRFYPERVGRLRPGSSYCVSGP